MAPAASSLNRKLVAIRGALHHALGGHSLMSSIHTSSKPSIQALRDTQHTGSTFTSSPPLFFGPATGCTGCKITSIGFTAMYGLVATEAADRAAKSAAALHKPHHG
ncbi:hypothetical protein GWK47_015253 [Chionoecetes opilio]|uniref:Uncharacterized protein n=1 Tax=Chionoecetes opilio TaxID=41210 RepID=A0A8J5CN19_CHIOP|nr:hypothetical protein GWK47_015253 [Chionoecetes opilio]